MKKRINIQFIVVTFVAVISTMILSIGVLYELFKTEIFNDMKTYTHVLNSTGVFTVSGGDYKFESDDLRITIIQDNGIVSYDNKVKDSGMDNHRNRPEIEQAFKEGEGSAIRKSQTLNKSTFYYAIRLKDGSVLRVAKEASSIWSIFINVFPAITSIVVLFLLAIAILTHFLTKSIVKPIEEMAVDMEKMEDIKIYKELKPFVDTIKKQHQDILKNAKIRQEFTANVSHELKTPLTSISGYSELIENGMATDDDVRRFASEIHRNSNRLLTLINDIIKLSELDDTEELEAMEEIDLFEIAKTATDMLQINAEKHDLTLNIKGCHCFIEGNKMMVEELIYNLTSNAIRYNTAGGKVLVNVNQDGEDVILSVKDNGIGIPKKHQERIFERFYRVDKSRSKSTGGTGLGLAIVKHIVAQHNATIEIDSEEGRGTTMSVIFKKHPQTI